MRLSKFFPRLYVFVFFALMLGCSTNDTDNFYNGALTTAISSDLFGYWEVYEIEYNGQIEDVPVKFTDCGRDFFEYRETGIYQEFLFLDSDCKTNMNQFQWELKNGVITLKNNVVGTKDFVITKLENGEIHFKTRMDVDEDGKLEDVTLFAINTYPRDFSFMDQTFKPEVVATEEGLVRFNWEPYSGSNTFQKYEVYRSAGENCSRTNAELVATITDVNETTFADLTPPVSGKLCYFLKVYTDLGLLGETYLKTIPTYLIPVEPVKMNEPMVLNNTIELSWAASETPYFSHYEVLVANHEPGIGDGYQDISVAIINDRNTTSWIDENPPYLENPYYYIRAYNIFGNYTDYSNEVTLYWQVPFKRPEILPLQQILSYAVDPTEPVVYLFGKESGDAYSDYPIFRFNYDSQQTEAISSINPGLLSGFPIKTIVSPYGKEVVVPQGAELYFYDATTLQFKYAVDPEGPSSMEDLNYDTVRDVWVLSDNDNMFTLERNNASLKLVDIAPHFAQHQGSAGYEFIILKNGQYLLGHPNETTSLVFDLDANGNFTGSQSVNIQFRSFYTNERLLYSSTGDVLLDTQGQQLFSSVTFQNAGAFARPNVPSGISVDGSTIFGTDNEYDWGINNLSPHKKEAILFNRNTSALTTIETIGYPHILFENFRGEVIGISSGFKKEDLYQNINNTSDFFMEKVLVP